MEQVFETYTWKVGLYITPLQVQGNSLYYALLGYRFCKTTLDLARDRLASIHREVTATDVLNEIGTGCCCRQGGAFAFQVARLAKDWVADVIAQLTKHFVGTWFSNDIPHNFEW